MGAPTDGQKSWFDEPKNVNLIIWLLILACLGSMVGYEFCHKHGYFDIEMTIPGFYGWYGFIAYSSIISGAVLMRKVVMRSEDFYDE